ncbi:hypothetical protein CW304_18170 [Bacillus sp. UFRGS-B20]|nr:hypothetical protein CW304_18170 [Bacillus sp. UFRGS-B20]
MLHVSSRTFVMFFLVSFSISLSCHWQLLLNPIIHTLQWFLDVWLPRSVSFSQSRFFQFPSLHNAARYLSNLLP